ncbi:MAG: hypothetical protein P4L50_14360 [Anaerolineaceae bacterium]|nr:hypothetical protein [Formivibrio sp.]MDR3575040.1 hypothetical protein [Anaerolineaceae bacterium]
MKQIQQFMLKYIRENAALIANSLNNFLPFQKKFYSDDCVIGNRRAEKLREFLGMTEHILSISQSADQATVITRCADKSGPLMRMKYGLVLVKASWFIKNIELECTACKGAPGNYGCPLCKGNGWHNLARQKHVAPRPIIPPLPPFSRF